jgi:hypothetical protein
MKNVKRDYHQHKQTKIDHRESKYRQQNKLRHEVETLKI